MSWTVTFKKKVIKQIRHLPVQVKDKLIALAKDIEVFGPVRGNWPNYSRLSDNLHHCHLKKGRVTYVAVWEIRKKEIKLVEITYAGTHEKAPY